MKHQTLLLMILMLGCTQPVKLNQTIIKEQPLLIKSFEIIHNQVRLGEVVYATATIKGLGDYNLTLLLDDKYYTNKVISLTSEKRISFEVKAGVGNHTLTLNNFTRGFIVTPVSKQSMLKTNFTHLTYFPVSLEVLKSKVNKAKLRENTMAGTISLISPFIYHFGVSHVEGTGKIYIYSPDNDNMLIISPADALIRKDSMNEVVNKKITTINGKEVYEDYDHLILTLDEHKHIRLGHVWILKSLVNEVMNSKREYYPIKAGTPIGYNNKDWAFDYYLYDDEVNNGPSHLQHYACPINYYNKTMRDEINEFYNEYVYEDMKASGKWPESRLCGEVNINLNNSVWGEWYYKSGYRAINEGSGWYYFKNGLLVFLNKLFVNNETFNKLWSNEPINQACPNWNGFYLGLNDDFTDGENFIGACVINTSNDNVLELKQFGNNSNTTKYFRFELIGDELTGEFFNDFSNAEKGFIKPTTYTKIESEAKPLLRE